MPPLIQLTDVSKTYAATRAPVRALRGVSCEIAAGESVAVVGASGSGKSTLLHVVGGLDVADAGAVVVAGKDLARLSDAARARFRNRTVGFVFQDFHLLPSLTAWENVAMPLTFARPRLRAATMRKRALDLLDDVGLAERVDHRPAELSGGEQQRVAIARALVTQPKLLLADEPTGNLDSATGRAILALFQRLRKRHGSTLVIASHDPAVAAIAERTLTMRDGAVR